MAALLTSARYRYETNEVIERNKAPMQRTLTVDLYAFPKNFLAYVEHNCKAKDAVKTVIHFEHKKQQTGSNGPLESLGLLASALCEHDSSGTATQRNLYKNFDKISSDYYHKQHAFDSVLRALQKRLEELPNLMPLLLTNTFPAMASLAASAAKEKNIKIECNAVIESVSCAVEMIPLKDI